MTSYRPFTDMMLLARARLKGGQKFYGAYPGGFLGRARALLGVRFDDPVLHVCGGKARLYPYDGFGPNDRTLDLDPACEPDFLQDARGPYPAGFRAVLADPPYGEDEARNYVPGSGKYPAPGRILKLGLDAVGPGGRVGILHYFAPKPPPETTFVAAIGVLVGFNNRIRVLSIFERRP